MSQTYRAILTIQILDSLFDSDGVLVSADSMTTGSSGFPTLDHALANGTGANKASKRFRTLKRSIGPGINDDWILNGVGGVTDKFGNTINFTKVKWIIFRLLSPVTGNKLRVGNAAGQPWPAWFGAAANTEDVQDLLIRCDQVDGWPVVANDKLRINNPTAGTLNYDLILAGE